jgi:vancomycin resistance protein VanW
MKFKIKKRTKAFCDLGPNCYKISTEKEIIKRNIKNLLTKEVFAREKTKNKLSNLVFEHSSNMIKRAPGIDIKLQLNKAINIDLASKKINGIIINPGETFSLWKVVGNPSKKNGYKEGRVIRVNGLVPGSGGGLCNLANTIHVLVLHSPLDVTEFHKHSDALAPDHGKRVPFSAGTSVSYNMLDFKFKNNTNQKFQLLLWCEGEMFYAELRSEKPLPYHYEIEEENHCFKKENDKYYRNSQIYKVTYDKKGKQINKKLILNNHSEVMFDYSLIPKDQIKD